MKRLVQVIILLLFSSAVHAQNIVEHLGIIQTNVDLSNRTVLGSVTISPTVPGKVIVRFDGTCTSDPGDRIILAASNTDNWGTNDGSVSVEAVDSDVDKRPFSHTRVYEVSAGDHTYNAIGHNYVETEGDGIASVYGSLTVKFIPKSTILVDHKEISQTNIDLTNERTVGRITINPPCPGKVIVHFDGKCISDPGDRIILAASNSNSWSPNEGNANVEAISNDLNRNSFSHSQVYDVQAGSQTFYAIAHNYVETAGDGEASIYGTLTVEFLPISNAIIGHDGVRQTRIDLSSRVTVGSVTIKPQEPGMAIVRFDGTCISSVGDRIVLASSDTDNWSPNDGNVNFEAASSMVPRNSFSHTRAYRVTAGLHTFNAIAHNYVETDGNGEASIYGNLTVEFIPGTTVGIPTWDEDELLSFYPNPTSGILQIDQPLNFFTEKSISIQILDIQGRILQKINPDLVQGHIDLSTYPTGFYFLQFLDRGNNTLSHRKIQKQ